MAKKIWIKANGNGAIATGHLRRCMTIAYELMQMGCEVTYILSDDDSDHTLHELSKEGGDEYDSIILHTKYSHPLQDMEALRVLMDEEKPDFFLIDSRRPALIGAQEDFAGAPAAIGIRFSMWIRTPASFSPQVSNTSFAAL